MKMRCVVTTVSGRNYFGAAQEVPENVDMDEVISELNNLLGDESGSLKIPGLDGKAHLIPTRQIECMIIEPEVE